MIVNKEAVSVLRKIFMKLDTADVEDAVQDAYVQLLENQPDLVHHPKQAGAFTYVTAKYRLLDKMKKEFVTDETGESIARQVPWEEDDGGDISPWNENLSFDPTDLMNMRLDIEKALEPFAEEEREIIVAYFGEGDSVRQIAADYPEKSHMTWYRWLNNVVKPYLTVALKDYAELFIARREQEEALEQL